jgi:T5SS/PEP-CTERM-associated repeat protein
MRSVLCAVVLAGTLAVSALAESTGNIIDNPGAEQGTNGWGWWGSDGVGLGYFASYDGYTPHSGNYWFYGGDADESYAYQFHYFSSEGITNNMIDNGEASIDVSWWNSAYDSGLFSTDDQAAVKVYFFNASDVLIKTAYDSGFKDSRNWTHYSASNIAIPVGTRYLKYVMDFDRHSGDDSDGYIDDNYLNIDYTRNVYWKSAVSGSWTDNSKWTAVTPMSTEDAIFNKAGAYTVSVPSTDSIRNITISAGTVTFNAGNAVLYVNNNLTVGTTTTPATMKITSGTVDLQGTGAHDIGSVTGSNGTLTVDGAGAHLRNNSYTTSWLGVGKAGNGSLLLSNGGHATVYAAYVGYAGGSGVIDLSGNGTTYDGTYLTLGGNSSKTTTGKGTMNVRAGTSVDIGNDLTVYNTTGTAINFSGGDITTGNLKLDSNPARFNWTGGKLTLNNGAISGLGTGSFAVPGGGVLAGRGIVAGKTVVATGGVIAPGYDSAAGYLTFNGDLTLSQHSDLVLKLRYGHAYSGYSDAINISGGKFTLGGADLHVVAADYIELNQPYHVVTYTNGATVDFSEMFSNMTLVAPGVGEYNDGFLHYYFYAGTGDLVFESVPEPTFLGLTLPAAMLVLGRRRQSSRRWRGSRGGEDADARARR